jgi:hypothetical protein
MLQSVSTPSSKVSQNLHEFKICIQEACESVDMHVLSSVWNQIDYPFHVHGIISGAHD